MIIIVWEVGAANRRTFL